MPNQSAPSDPSDRAAALEHELLARLGLGPGASNEQIEAAHEDVVGYLESAPGGLRAWSAHQVAAADKAYALLRGSREELLAATGSLTEFAAPNPESAGMLSPDTTPPLSTTIRPALPQPPTTLGRSTETDLLDDHDDDTAAADQPATRRGRREAQRRAQAAARHGTAGGVGAAGFIRRGALVAAIAVGAVVIALVGYNLGAPVVPATGAVATPGTADGGPDRARIAALMEKLAANPSDIATLQSLADEYYAAEDFPTAIGFMEKIVEIDPANIPALLGLGAASFNDGDTSTAETAWKKVVEIDPKNVEAHYDLGFLYLNANDVEGATREWQMVVELDPTSDIAQTVQQHLDALAAQASDAPSTSPAASPAATPAESPAASGSAVP